MRSRFCQQLFDNSFRQLARSLIFFQHDSNSLTFFDFIAGYVIHFVLLSLLSPAMLRNDLQNRFANSGKARLFWNYLNDHWTIFFCAAMYKSSTFFLAQGVLRKNFRLDLTDGSFLKQRILIRSPNSPHPYRSTRLFTICSSVMPCSGLCTCCPLTIYSFSFPWWNFIYFV